MAWLYVQELDPNAQGDQPLVNLSRVETIHVQKGRLYFSFSSASSIFWTFSKDIDMGWVVQKLQDMMLIGETE